MTLWNYNHYEWVTNNYTSSRGEICRRQCKFFASSVNVFILTHFLVFLSTKLLKFNENKGVKFLAWNSGSIIFLTNPMSAFFTESGQIKPVAGVWLKCWSQSFVKIFHNMKNFSALPTFSLKHAIKTSNKKCQQNCFTFQTSQMLYWDADIAFWVPWVIYRREGQEMSLYSYANAMEMRK